MVVVLEDWISFWRALTLPAILPVEVAVGLGKVNSGSDEAPIERLSVALLVGVVEQDTIAVVVLRATTVIVVLIDWIRSVCRWIFFAYIGNIATVVVRRVIQSRSAVNGWSAPRFVPQTARKQSSSEHWPCLATRLAAAANVELMTMLTVETLMVVCNK